MNFKNWIETYCSEKQIDMEQVLEVSGRSGANCIPIGCLIESMISTSSAEQSAIKAMIVKIDFVNGDVLHYFRHLAQAIAL